MKRFGIKGTQLSAKFGENNIETPFKDSERNLFRTVFTCNRS